MRTTLTLEDDVAVHLKREQRKRRVSFKALVNDVLRLGLDALHRPRQTSEPFRTRGFDLGPSVIGSLDDIEGVLSSAEGERHS